MIRSLAAAVLLLVSAAASARSHEPAPILNVNGVDGHRTTVRPARLRAPLLVHFFALHDADWRDQLLRLKAFDARHRGQGLALISFAAPMPGAREVLAAFAASNGIHFPVAVDDGNLSAFSRDRVPRLVLISPDAEVALRLYDGPGAAALSRVADLLPAMSDRAREIRALAAARARHEKQVLAAASRVTAMTPETLKARLASHPALFFIGDRKVFAAKHIPGALLLDAARVDEFFRDKDKAVEWIFYCDRARDALGPSGRVAAELSLKGFARTAYLKGQLQGWEQRGYPLDGGTKR